jgi:hypothetical protein
MAGKRHVPAAHQDTTMGKTPAQMVIRGMAMNMGVVMAPTTYDHTPVQYMRRWKRERPFWNRGQCSLDNMIWKCPCIATPFKHR